VQVMLEGLLRACLKGVLLLGVSWSSAPVYTKFRQLAHVVSAAGGLWTFEPGKCGVIQ
jgi:hypothetical protein